MRPDSKIQIHGKEGGGVRQTMEITFIIPPLVGWSFVDSFRGLSDRATRGCTCGGFNVFRLYDFR